MMNFYISEPFRVRFSETDMAGVVHFTQFFRWAENAESEFFRVHKIPFVCKNGETLSGWPRVHARADFFVPAHYGDCIRACIRPKKPVNENTSAICWEFEIRRIETDGSEKLLARGEWVSVYATMNFKSGILRAEQTIPEALKKVLDFS